MSTLAAYKALPASTASNPSRPANPPHRPLKRWYRPIRPPSQLIGRPSFKKLSTPVKTLDFLSAQAAHGRHVTTTVAHIKHGSWYPTTPKTHNTYIHLLLQTHSYNSSCRDHSSN